MNVEYPGDSPPSTFDSASYWASRVGGREGLADVGHKALGPAYNAVIYRRREQALSSVLDTLAFDPQRANVLDLGCGSGFYVSFWSRAGVAELTGVDISAQAIEGLRRRHPRFDFLQLDITAPPWPSVLAGPFEVITLMDVVYHILDDTALSNLLESCAQRLAPGGLLLLTEVGTEHRISIVRHVVFRSAREWLALLSRAGLRLESRTSLFQLLEPPLSRSRSRSILIAGAYRLAGAVLRRLPRAATAMASGLAALDQRLIHGGARLSNHELWVVRKADPERDVPRDEGAGLR